MKWFGDLLGLVSIAALCVFSLVLVQTGSNKTSITPKVGQVASAQSVRFTETPGLPSPNYILELTNKERQARGLPTLTVNQELEKLAQQRAQDMVQNNYYAHMDKAGKYYYDYMPSMGIKTSYSCENLELSFAAEPAQYIHDWMTSQAHKNCLLKTNVAQAGYAVAKLALPGSPDVNNFVVVAIHSADMVTK